MDLEFLLSFNAKTYSINQKGDRTIALAYSKNNLESPPLHYTFLCLLHLENPVKPGVPEVVKKLKEKGVRTIILTGDRPETAMKIGREIGIDNSNYCLTGKNIAQMELSEVARQSDHVSIFARLLPSQKGALIMLMQQRKNIVAMVGDGANDAVALKLADVGISFVEKSSPSAKRVSKILVNDLADLLTIIQSVRRVMWWIECLMLFRVIILISMLLILYIFSI
jgi:Ca2+-transporting ATPase